jgi:GTPase SAR1 family protein
MSEGSKSEATVPAPNGGAAPNIQALSKYKIVFLGDQGVGKTSIITRFVCENPHTSSDRLPYILYGIVQQYK